ELLIRACATNARRPENRDTRADIAADGRPFQNTSGFQAKRRRRKFLNRDERFGWLDRLGRLGRPPGTFQNVRSRRHVARPCESKLCVQETACTFLQGKLLEGLSVDGR